jgi:hypothetical protein
MSAGELRAFKIDTLSELARKKGISMRNATKDSLVNELSRVLKRADLSKAQLAELGHLQSVGGASSGGYSSSYGASSGGDRFANYSSSGSSRASSHGGSSGGSGGAGALSAGDLSAFKIVDLVEIAAKKGVSGGRNATRDRLTNELVRAGVSLSDLTRGQLVDLGIKLGKAGLSRDVNRARQELAALIGGSGSAPSRCARCVCRCWRLARWWCVGGAGGA